MGRPSTIRQLSPNAREALDRWLRDDAITQTEATARVNALLAGLDPPRAPVSRQAVQRYYQATRRIDWWRKEPRKIAARIESGTAEAARAAGRAMARLIARRLPAEVRMHCVAALAEGLAKAQDVGIGPRVKPARLVSREVDLTEAEAHAGAGLSFTVRELAEACGVSARHLQHVAKRDGWPRLKEPWPGGFRYRYRFEELPAHVARQALPWREGWSPE